MKQFICVLLVVLCGMKIVAQSVAENIYTFDCKQECIEQEKAIKMLSDFYSRYLLGRQGIAHFQLDATKYCTPRFLSKLGEDYEKQLKEDYIISQEELGLEWWSFYNFINGYQDGPHDINEVMKVVHEHDNTYRIYFIENGYENHRLIGLEFCR